MLLKSIFCNFSNSLLKPQPFFSINLFRGYKAITPKEFEEFNEKIYPPQEPGETPRPGFLCHAIENVKYSPKKLWYIACFVRGMSVDEALKQLGYVTKKGARIVEEVILEAQSRAVAEGVVEYKSDLWVSESFVERGIIIKGLRRCARGRMCTIRYRYSNYFVTLEQGTPPKDYYYFSRKKSGEELLTEWLDKQRKRKIVKSL